MSAAAVVKNDISYHFLDKDGDEDLWDDLDFQFKKAGADPPMRGLCKVAVAIDAEGSTSFYCLQPLMHAEPLFLHPNHRVGATEENSILTNLVAMIWALIERNLQIGVSVYIVADKPATQRMCEAAGMKQVKSPVYVKTIKPPGSNGRH